MALSLSRRHSTKVKSKKSKNRLVAVTPHKKALMSSKCNLEPVNVKRNMNDFNVIQGQKATVDY